MAYDSCDYSQDCSSRLLHFLSASKVNGDVFIRQNLKHGFLLGDHKEENQSKGAGNFDVPHFSTMRLLSNE